MAGRRYHDRSVQRLIHAVLRCRDVVVELTGERVPARMDNAECAVAILPIVHEDAQPIHIIDLVD